MRFPFSTAIPRHWMHGSAVGSALANSLNLLFPLGERFFVRSVRAHLDRIDDPELRERAHGFFAQESLHAREHERFFEIMREQGFELERFLRPYQHLAFEVLEPRMPENLRLAITAACEHFTATFAENALGTDLLDGIHPVMRELLCWHAAEEIEHKSVAYDVLSAVDPRYRVRAAGLVLATIGFVGFWFAGAFILLRQERELPRARLIAELWRAFEEGHFGQGDIARAFVQYLRPGFHPSQIDNTGLARSFLAGIGRLSG
jgi:uncharacterized protein